MRRNYHAHASRPQVSAPRTGESMEEAANLDDQPGSEHLRLESGNAR